LILHFAKYVEKQYKIVYSKGVWKNTKMKEREKQMRKTLLSILFLVILLLVPTVLFATEGDVAQVGTEKFQTLEAALNAAMGTENEVTLLKDATLLATYKVTDNLTINLGGFDITGAVTVFHVEGAEFTVKGNGTIKEAQPDFAAIFVRGSANSTDKNYSVVNVENGVTLQGWTGILVKGPKDDSQYAYGVAINCNGTTINSVLDQAGGTGHGIYINGNVKNQENPVTINVVDTSITSKGTGIYAGGYGVWNITNTTMKAPEMALGIKSGTIVLNNVVAEVNGPASKPQGNGNGITATGAAIQIEEHKSYAGKIHLTINSGKYASENNFAILEYTTSEPGITFVEDIQINGGTFISGEGKDVMTLSDSFKETITDGFIKGGTFSSDVQGYIAPYHVCEKEDSNYTVYKLHDITVNSTEGGTASSDLIRAKEGTKIGLVINPNEGYEFKEAIITDTLGIKFRTTNQYFLMPNSDVIVEVVFGEIKKEEPGDEEEKEEPEEEQVKQEIQIPDTIEDTEKVQNVIMESLKGIEKFEEIIKNKNIEVKLKIEENKITETRKEEIEKVLKENEKIAKYLDITIFINNKDTNEIDTLDKLNENIRLTVSIPEDLPKVAEGFARKYYIIRNHNGVIEYLDAILSEDGKSILFETDRFSAYALAYSDEEIVTSEGVPGETIEEPKEEPKDNESILEESKTEEGNTDIPNTGDNIVLYVLLAIVAICGIILAKKVNIKKSKH